MIKGTDSLAAKPLKPVDDVWEDQLSSLITTCKQELNSVNEELIRDAFYLAFHAHRDARRASGEMYISHPLAVAQIVAKDIGFDDLSVAAALLHDVVEDTEFSLAYIQERFGEHLARVIDGLTKIKGVFAKGEYGQAENVRKLMLSMATDIRVILVKFADRLHNMRTIESLPKQKQIKIAGETLDLFAPLAHRFGLFALKSELEDLCLKVLNPEIYYEIVRGLNATKTERKSYIDRFITPLENHLKDNGFDFEIYGRPKHLYSVARKMQRQEKTLEEIYDLFAIRIVLTSDGKKGKEDCWRVYSVITDLYRPLPERFRDFLSVPKSNGYQSLHTTVLGPEGRRVEIQIRTQEMHRIAERGVAAHWLYKEGASEMDDQLSRFLTWVRDLLENPRPEQAADFVEEFRLNLYEQEIYVFTPKGDLVTLPQQATPVDFAFQVHSEVGFHCIGAKVNGKMVPLSQRLQSGDQVEVITSKKQAPNPDWMKFVVTHKARARIRHWINEKRRRAVDYGKEVLQKRLQRENLEVDDQDLHRTASAFKFPNLQQLHYELGTGLLAVDEVVRFLKRQNIADQEQEEASEGAAALSFESFLGTAQASGRPALKIDGELHTDIVTQYATCCNPIPGDDVFGFISKNGSIKIHRVNCRNAPHLLMNYTNRIMPVEWSRQKDVQFVTALRIMGEDRVGILSDITTLVSRNLKTNIRSITVDTDDGIFEGNLVLNVADVEHLHRLIARIKRIDGIHGVYRFEQTGETSVD